MKINIYKSIYNFQETNTNFLENLESLNDDNYELLNDKELVSDSNELKLISKVYIRKKDKKLLDWQLLIKNVYLDTEEDDNLFSESGHHFDAILFLKEDTTLQNNVYIIPFGQAYHDINNLIDYDFGIDFAERAIKNEDIVNKNVNFFQQNRLKEIVNYRRNSVDYVRPSESYISVQGHPQNPQIFGKTMTCGTSISLRVPNRKQQFIDKISVIIKEINAIINLPQKISEFPRIVTLKDLNKIEVLDTLLLKKLSNSSTTENISIDISRFLELSNMILLLDDMLDVNIYINSFKNNTLETFDATDPEVDYITEIGDYLLKYDVNSINDVRIEVIDNLGHSNNMLLKTILHAEVEMEDGKKYLLQNGKWGYFNREFFDLLNDHLNEIEIRYNTLTPTGLVFKEGEEGYIKEIVGSNNGFFDLDNCDDLIEKINESKADILFVAMGAPRQEVFIEKYKDKLCCKIFMGVGGSFDVFAGNVNRAPQFMINIGMEWLYRVAKEPWRIKRLGSIPKFLVLSLKERGKR